MKQYVFLALSLLVSTSVFAGWMPSKDSAQYHTAQFAAGFAAGYIADSLQMSIGGNQSARNLTVLLLNCSVLKAPDALNQTKLLKPYADQNKTDSGRWAYFLGMYLRGNVWRTLGY